LSLVAKHRRMLLARLCALFTISLILYDWLANIAGLEQDIVNRETGLQTTIIPYMRGKLVNFGVAKSESRTRVSISAPNQLFRMLMSRLPRSDAWNRPSLLYIFHGRQQWRLFRPAWEETSHWYSLSFQANNDGTITMVVCLVRVEHYLRPRCRHCSKLIYTQCDSQNQTCHSGVYWTKPYRTGSRTQTRKSCISLILSKRRAVQQHSPGGCPDATILVSLPPASTSSTLFEMKHCQVFPASISSCVTAAIFSLPAEQSTESSLMFNVNVASRLFCAVSIGNKKLSYRRETARQLPTWRGLSPPAHFPATPSGYTYAYGRIRNPQQTYVKRAVRKTHFKLNRAFKVIQSYLYLCRQESRTVYCRNVQLMLT